MKILVMMSFLVGSTQALSQTRPAAGPPPVAGTCSRLAATYESTSKGLAATFAEGLGDNSAPRATLRTMEDANSLAKAHMTLDLMRDYHCPMPKDAPDSVYYLATALTCATDRLKASGSGSPASCDRTKWVRAGN